MTIFNFQVEDAARAGAKAERPPPELFTRSLGLARELAVAVGLVGATTIVRWALGHMFPGLGVFALYFPAVLLAALIGGWRSGIAAVFLTGAVALGLFLKPGVTIRMTDPTSPGNLALVVLATAPIVFVGDYVRSLVARLRRGASELADRNLHYDALFGSMLEGYALCEAIWADDGELADYRIVDMNPALQRMLRVGPEAIGTRLLEGRGDWTAWLKFCGRVMRTGEPAGFERHDVASDRWHEIRITRVTENLMAQVFFDITERKRAEVRQAGLFDELNHRVSNNLTLVSTILRLKSRSTDLPEVREQLVNMEARVHSIAQVHRALYQGGQTDNVEFGRYLQNLCESIRESLTVDDRIMVEVKAEPILLPIDTAIPLGMVVNELITNAIKYAYPYPARGLISVDLAGMDGGLRLKVHDAGPGMGEEAERASTGLGMRLVKSLVSQVHGTFTVSRAGGTTFEVSAPMTPTN